MQAESGQDHRPAARLVDRLRGVAIDLDGTLVDSIPDLADAANAMLVAIGASPLPEPHIATMVGGGIEALVERTLAMALDEPLPAGLFDRALARFRETYGQHLFDRSRVYPGVLPALAALRAEGLAICCVTNKAASFAEPLLTAAGIDGYLAGVLSPRQPAERKPGPALLMRACEMLGIAPAELLCVGDSRADVAAARAAGCPVAAVDYGYHHDHLQGDGAPDWLISSLTEIVLLSATAPMPRPELKRARRC